LAPGSVARVPTAAGLGGGPPLADVDGDDAADPRERFLHPRAVGAAEVRGAQHDDAALDAQRRRARPEFPLEHRRRVSGHVRIAWNGRRLRDRRADERQPEPGQEQNGPHESHPPFGVRR